jgi:DNA-directed RNA polymerase subunit RPC12/RpoP
MLVNILGITDDAKCYELVRHLRWPDGVRCPHCDSPHVLKQGRDDTEPQRQRYECQPCGRRFDYLTDTIFAATVNIVSDTQEAGSRRKQEPGAGDLLAPKLPAPANGDLGERDMSGGVAQGECEGMCGM